MQHIALSTKRFEKSKAVGSFYVMGDPFSFGSKHVLVKGEAIGHGPEWIAEHVASSGIEAVKDISGDFFVILFDDQNKELSFANDRLGRETLLIGERGQDLYLSDDFWTMARLTQFCLEDIDEQSVKEFVFFLYPLFDKTILRHVKLLPPATIGKWNSTASINMTTYWDFRFRKNLYNDIDEALNNLDLALHSAMDSIQTLNPNAVYGVGISGGLDSRIIPHIAMAHDMPLKSFIIGTSKPRGLWLSNDHANAQRIAALYDLEHREIEYDECHLEEKLRQDTTYNPLGDAEIVKTISCDLPFDILLNGQTSMLMIRWIGEMSNFLNEKDLLNALLKSFTRLVPVHSELSKGRAYLTGKSNNDVIPDYLPGLLNYEEVNTTIRSIMDFISKNNEKTHREIYQKYAIWHIATKSKNGIFESLHGKKKAYSIYYPFLLNEVLSWKKEFFKDRLIIKEYIRRYAPKLSKIRTPDPTPGFSKNGQTSSWMKYSAFLSFAIRGRGVVRYRSWMASQQVKNFCDHVFNRPNSLFNRLFDLNAVKSLPLGYFRLTENLLKVKHLLDLIESGQFPNDG
jgi:hypothetical protein